MNKFLGGILLFVTANTGFAQDGYKPLYQNKDIVLRKTPFQFEIPGQGESKEVSGVQFLYDRISYGIQMQKPAQLKDYGNPALDFSRLATTYYHRHSPVGIALEKFNWFPGPINTYWADARLPVSLIGSLAQTNSLNGLATLWSEPPVLTVGMHMGTLASYARPLQHWHFIEGNPELIKMCLEPIEGTRYFHFVNDALGRGAQIKIQEGEGRPQIEKAPDAFYHLIIVEGILKGNDQKLRERLLTKEGMKWCMDKLVPGGMLCYHTSCRYYLLAEQVSSTAAKLGFVTKVGHDDFYDPRRNDGTYTCQWVMVAKKNDDFKHLKDPPDRGKKADFNRGNREFWSAGKTDDRFVWTDAKINYQGMYLSDPFLYRPLQNWYYDLANYLPYRLREYDSFLERNVRSLLDSVNRYRVRQLNGE
jgi:hypothetical protein